MSKAFIYEVTCTKEFTTWVEADCAAEAEDAARRGIEDPEHWETKAVQVRPASQFGLSELPPEQQEFLRGGQ